YPKSVHARDALYWRAWALYKLGFERNARTDLDASLTALVEQARLYGATADGRDLRVRVQTALAKLGDSDAAAKVSREAQGLEKSKGCPSDDDDVRIVALEGLMQMNAESALPILKQVLAKRGDCTEELRKKAVFIISQKRSSEATSLLLEAARSDPSAEVRGEAIQWLGQTRSPEAVASLDSVLFAAKDDDLRNKALFALSQIRSADATRSMRR